jgi:hypothetical protein
MLSETVGEKPAEVGRVRFIAVPLFTDIRKGSDYHDSIKLLYTFWFSIVQF